MITFKVCIELPFENRSWPVRLADFEEYRLWLNRNVSDDDWDIVSTSMRELDRPLSVDFKYERDAIAFKLKFPTPQAGV